ncbi:MAG: hypothetical protein ACQEW8_09595 [Actinomycetota bacterium]
MTNADSTDSTAEDAPQESSDREPTTQELQEPSTEKEPGQEPTSPKKTVAEPDHEAVGIGVVGRPQFDPDDTAKD